VNNMVQDLISTLLFDVADENGPHKAITWVASVLCRPTLVVFICRPTSMQ
jgi:hypothetical protein